MYTVTGQDVKPNGKRRRKNQNKEHKGKAKEQGKCQTRKQRRLKLNPEGQRGGQKVQR